ncbi:MAG TPA: AGE family epimerase/isomerase [Verrucomicrobiae bacterium]|jgi:N-acylglucosamine 2-epimerase|nr:AGE family epimerase/isomerase [Verrucomicrobiae bacterium]
MNNPRLLRIYRDLLDGIVAFWARHGVDEQYGGVLSCMKEDGSPVSTDKYIWSQARWVWVCSALYNRIEKRPEYLKWARAAIDFLLHHARDAEGRFVFRTTREGKIVEGATSIYSDCFVVYGLSEYCRSAPSARLLAEARSIFDRIRQRVEEVDFSETAPYKLPPNRRNHGVPMILTEVAGELSRTTNDSRIAAAADAYSQLVMTRFLRQDRRCVLEFLDRDYREVPAPEGTFVMPGHAIESMWFTMHRSLARNDDATTRLAAESIRWHLEKGWDKEYGGIFLGMDVEGQSPFLPHSDTKVWWPHTEALYGLLLAHKLTGEQWCETWYERVHEWAFSHFAMPETGEWRQRLDRAGDPISTIVALPVKDPFHLPRAAILAIELLQGGRP